MQFSSSLPRDVLHNDLILPPPIDGIWDGIIDDELLVESIIEANKILYPTLQVKFEKEEFGKEENQQHHDNYPFLIDEKIKCQQGQDEFEAFLNQHIQQCEINFQPLPVHLEEQQLQQQLQQLYQPQQYQQQHQPQHQYQQQQHAIMKVQSPEKKHLQQYEPDFSKISSNLKRKRSFSPEEQQNSCSVSLKRKRRVNIASYFRLTQKEAANAIGISQPLLSMRWKENSLGRPWPRRRIRKIESDLGALERARKTQTLHPADQQRLEQKITRLHVELSQQLREFNIYL